MNFDREQLNVIDDTTLHATAVRMLADYDARTPGTIYGSDFRLDLADSWRVQTAVTRLREARGEKVIGYKVGCVSKSNQKLMDVPHPVWGRLWDTELHKTQAALSKENYANIAIEAEFGVTLSRDLVPGMTMNEIVASVAALYPLLELHNLVMRGDRPHGHELVANNCINCGVVLGPPVTDPGASIDTDLKLIYDGIEVDGWNNLAWPDDILSSVPWLTQSLAEHQITLRRGDLLLTGAWGPPIALEERTRVDVTSSAFGDARATFA